MCEGGKKKEKEKTEPQRRISCFRCWCLLASEKSVYGDGEPVEAYRLISGEGEKKVGRKKKKKETQESPSWADVSEANFTVQSVTDGRRLAACLRGRWPSAEVYLRLFPFRLICIYKEGGQEGGGGAETFLRLCQVIASPTLRVRVCLPATGGTFLFFFSFFSFRATALVPALQLAP